MGAGDVVVRTPDVLTRLDAVYDPAAAALVNSRGVDAFLDDAR